MVSKILVFTALFSLALAKPYPRSMTVLESRQSVPSGYVHNGAADSTSQIKLRIALAQSNPEGLVDALYSVSTPTSATYGEHLSKEEVRFLIFYTKFSETQILHVLG